MKNFIASVLVSVGIFSATPVSAIPAVCEIQNLDFSKLVGWSTPPSLWDGQGINVNMRRSPDGNTVVGKLFYGKSGNPVGSYIVSYFEGQTTVAYCLNGNLRLNLDLTEKTTKIKASFLVFGVGSETVLGRNFFFWND